MAAQGAGRRAPAERALAWLYTGPLGHLWSIVADLTVLWFRWAVARTGRRMKRLRGGQV